LRIRKGAKPSDAYFQFWLPLRDLTPNKQEQFTPVRREPSELLALGVNVSGIRIERDKSRKLKYLKSTNGNGAQFYWVNKNVFDSLWRGLHLVLRLNSPLLCSIVCFLLWF